MYRYDAIDHTIVRERAAQYRDQLRRYLAGQLSEDEFRPLRLQNGLYIQRHAPMLRIAIPQGVLSAEQMRKLASIARRYVLAHTTRSVKARVTGAEARLDVHTLAWRADGDAVGLNDIVRLTLRTQQPLAADSYRANRATGSFILIDEATNDTVAAGLID